MLEPEQFAQPSNSLPQYTVRESHKAKNVRLTLSVWHGLEVTVPKGFDHDSIPELLQQKQRWIEKTTQRLAARQQLFALEGPETLTQRICLRAIAEDWQVDYHLAENARPTVTELDGLRLSVCGNIHDTPACQTALRQWLMRKAKAHLVPWLRAASQGVQLSFNQASVRGQKTRWASCSSRKTISLNYKLLFLPSPLVHYVFVHELCHTIQLNHSAKFWKLVSQKEPDYQQLDAELRQAWCYVPGWVDRS